MPLPMAESIIEITMPKYEFCNILGKIPKLASPKNAMPCDMIARGLYPILSTNFIDKVSTTNCVTKFIVINNESFSNVMLNLSLKITNKRGAMLFIIP